MKTISLLVVLIGCGLASAGKDNDLDLQYTVTGEVWLKVAMKDVKESPSTSATNLGTIVIGLFGDIAPMTTNNFAQLAKGFKRGHVGCVSNAHPLTTAVFFIQFCFLENLRI